MEPPECWIIQSFFLSFVCPVMSPNRPQSIAEHAQTCARVGKPHSRVGGSIKRQPPPPSNVLWYSFVIDMAAVCGCGVEKV